MPPKLIDIARAVGVKIPTVSVVLNNKTNPIKISEKTRSHILRVAKELGYQPNAAARSLVTKRTGHIGYIMSDQIAGGLANAYFAAYLSGVEKACRTRGYGLNVSLYNLTDVDSFIFPSRVSGKTVDGLILSGYVEAAIVRRFLEFGIPCISLGQDVEVAELVPTLAADDVEGLFQAVEYAAQLGHRRFLHNHSPRRRGREVARLLAERIKKSPLTRDCLLIDIEPPTGHCDYSAGKPLVEAWLAIPEDQRPTAIFASDQTLQVVLKELDKRNLKCPRDVSLVSNCESPLCEFANPALTAVDHKMEHTGEVAAQMMIDHLKSGKPLTPEKSLNNYPCNFIIRESCGTPPSNGKINRGSKNVSL